MKGDTLIVPDLHVPHHDAARVREVLRWARAERPRRIVLIGDVADAYSLSRFGKVLTVASSSVAAEMRMVSGIISTMTRLSTSVVWLAGNHEDRFRKRCAELPFLAPYAPDPFAALARECGVRYIPSGLLLLERDRLICHGEHGGMPVRAEAKARKMGLSVLQGHTHALRLAWLGPNWYSCEVGHLVDPRAPVFTYMAGAADGLAGWCPGFCWLDTEGIPHVERL